MSDQPEKVTERGRLLEVNWANLSAELHTPMGIVRLEFAEDLAETMRGAARQHVAITGVRRITPDGFVRATAVEEVTIQESTPTPPFGMSGEAKLIRTRRFDPLDFDHPGMPDSERLDAWVDAILNEEYDQ